MNLITLVYLVYITLSVSITVLVGRKLHHHGRTFLVDVFCGTERQADAVNNLLLVGYYLTNVAFVLFLLRSRVEVPHSIAALHLLSHKFGVVLTTLGTMHFFNVFVLLRVRGYIRWHYVERGV